MITILGGLLSSEKDMPFPNGYKEVMQQKNSPKNMTIRIQDMQGKYKKGDVCNVTDYDGNPWGSKIIIQKVITLPIKDLTKELGLPLKRHEYGTSYDISNESGLADVIYFDRFGS